MLTKTIQCYNVQVWVERFISTAVYVTVHINETTKFAGFSKLLKKNKKKFRRRSSRVIEKPRHSVKDKEIEFKSFVYIKVKIDGIK